MYIQSSSSLSRAVVRYSGLIVLYGLNDPCLPVGLIFVSPLSASISSSDNSAAGSWLFLPNKSILNNANWVSIFFQTCLFLCFFAERELNSGVINNLVFRNIMDCGDLFVLLSGEEERLGHDAGVNPLGVVSLENVQSINVDNSRVPRRAICMSRPYWWFSTVYSNPWKAPHGGFLVPELDQFKGHHQRPPENAPLWLKNGQALQNQNRLTFQPRQCTSCPCSRGRKYRAKRQK